MAEFGNDSTRDIAKNNPEAKPDGRPDFSNEIAADPAIGTGARDRASDDAAMKTLGFPSSSDLLPQEPAAGASQTAPFDQNASSSLVQNEDGTTSEITKNGNFGERRDFTDTGRLSQRIVQTPDTVTRTQFPEKGTPVTTRKFFHPGIRG